MQNAVDVSLTDGQVCLRHQRLEIRLAEAKFGPFRKRVKVNPGTVHTTPPHREPTCVPLDIAKTLICGTNK